MTAEVVTALRAAGIEPVLLKGPSIAQWLYPADFRPYGDTDLLVSPSDFAGAARVLRRIGFGNPTRGRALHAHTYRKLGTELSQPLCVDLHRSLPYLRASTREAWRVLSKGHDTVLVAGTEVRVLSIPQRVFHIAIHSVQHAFETQNPFEDLRRALAAVSADDLTATVVISRNLGAEDALVAGLSLIPEGQDVVQRLQLSPECRDLFRFKGGTEVESAAYQFQRMVDARSVGERVDVLVDMVVASPAVLRETSALARRGPAGLVLAYAARPFVLASRIGPALLTRRRILREHD